MGKNKKDKFKKKSSRTRILEIANKPYKNIAAPGENVKANFEFEIKVPPQAKLVRINIDGSQIKGNELLKLTLTAIDGVIKGEKFVPLVDDKIFLIIDAVGEPNIELQLLSLKFIEKEIFNEEKPFMIGNNRRAQLAINSITLP